jgi:hypothetical protein
VAENKPKAKRKPAATKKATRAKVTKPITAAPVAKSRTVYDLRQWRRRPLYQCRACPFNTLEERVFWEHWNAAHAPPRPKLSALVGPDGKPLKGE